MKTLLAVTVLGTAAYLVLKRVDGTALLNRAMANCYRDSARNLDWYK